MHKRSMRGFMKEQPSMLHQSYVEPPMLIIPSQDSALSGLHGGSSWFSRQFRHVGHILAPIAKQAVNEAKDIGKKAVNSALREGKSVLQHEILSRLSSPSSVAEEAPEMALAGAGMKKKRKVSEKMNRRHDLVRKLMKEHGMTLPEASSYIKEHNLV